MYAKNIFYFRFEGRLIETFRASSWHSIVYVNLILHHGQPHRRRQRHMWDHSQSISKTPIPSEACQLYLYSSYYIYQ